MDDFFLRPEQRTQERIYKRNSPQMAERFLNEWIPMEHLYFEKMCVKERCDVVIEINK
ncbi:MAG: hypothetical protein IJY10_03335 [Lachnospiraceae bacterium]|nr:hypothetical protein [Lachnospiraceae bacterium]